MPEIEGTRVRLNLEELEIASLGDFVREIISYMSRKFLRAAVNEEWGYLNLVYSSLRYALPSIRTLSKCTSTISVFQNYS